MKILILKPSSLGDVIQALPVLRLIKRHLPAAEVWWWIDSRLAPLLEGDPDLQRLLRFDRRGWMQPANWRKAWNSLRAVRQQHFDWVIDLQCLARSAAFGWLANGRLYVGLDETREGARGFYDLVARRESYHTHAVDWYRAVLPLLGIPDTANFEWLPKRPQVAEALCRRLPLTNGKWIAIQPGARWLNKRWPVEHFRLLVREILKQRPEVCVMVLGGNEDRQLGKAIVENLPRERGVDLTGQLSLPEMIECLRKVDLMVTNDTGPMHVAAALGKPVVALFGPTEPYRTGPYGQVEQALKVDIPCVPCMSPRCRNPVHLECLHALAPNTVFADLHQRLPRTS